MTKLPTPDEILDHAATELDTALKALGDAGDWLRSDWQPIGRPLTRGQAAARDRMFRAIDEAKGAIDRSNRWERGR